MSRRGGKFGWNYPPGAANDPRAPYNQPDHSHDHRWRPVEDTDYFIEDGAAIFHRQCEYAEGRHGEGWQCEEMDQYRFEYDRLILLDGGEIELPTIENWDKMTEELENVVMGIEGAYHSPDFQTSIDVDPDPVAGQVTIDYLGYSLIFSPQ